MTMPSLVGFHACYAIPILGAQRVRWRISYQATPYATGIVIGQSPAGGSALTEIVSLTVSAGINFQTRETLSN